MRLYLDSSLVVTALVTEPSSKSVVTWLARHASHRFVVSDWVVIEFSTALSVKLLSGRISSEAQELALARLNEFIASEVECLPVARRHFQLAAAFTDRGIVGLRAADALHLAISSNGNGKLCTRDRRQAEAGTVLGLSTELVP